MYYTQNKIEKSLKELQIEELNSQEEDKQHKLDTTTQFDTHTQLNTRTQFSTHAPTVQKVNITTVQGEKSLYALQKIFNPTSLYRSNYIVMDSKNRDITGSSIKKMKWLHLNNSNFTTGTINTSGENIKDIVGLRIYPCRFSRNISNVFVYDNLYTILIEEFASQSYLLHQNRKCHFILRKTLGFGSSNVSPAVDGTELKPVNDGYFWFNKVVTDFNSLTISIGNPHVLVDIPIANFSIPSNNFSNTSPTIITCYNQTGFTTGDNVIISGFTTDDPIGDSVVINEINNIAGHAITYIDTLHFSIAVDCSGITPYSGGLNLALVKNESVNCIIPLEIISMKQG